MFYVRLGERQENTTGRTPNIFLFHIKLILDQKSINRISNSTVILKSHYI
jgi:hypothetical protein